MIYENWRPVVGYEGLYEVSDFGRVYSVGRTIATRNRHGPQLRVVKRKFLKPSLNPGGYLTVGLYNSKGVRATVTVQRLVLDAFVGPKPAGFHRCHGPGGKRDNRLCNLRYDTPVANNADKKRDGTWQGGENSHFAKLTHDDVTEIRALYESERGKPRYGRKWTYRTLGKKFGVDQSSIGKIINQRVWNFAGIR